jgi:hypothetical protein
LFNKAILKAGMVIIITKPWSTMNYTSTSVACDEICSNYSEAFLLFHVGEIVEQWDIFLSNKRSTWDLF